MSVISVIGHLTADPELQFTPEGVARCRFTIAETERVFDRATGGWKDGHTNFIRVTLWRQDAENAAESLTKGARVLASGKLVVRSFDRTDGTKGLSVELQDAEIGVSLRFAQAAVTKMTRQGQGQVAAPQQSAPPQTHPAPAAAPAAPAPAAAPAGAAAFSGDYF